MAGRGVVVAGVLRSAWAEIWDDRLLGGQARRGERGRDSAGSCASRGREGRERGAGVRHRPAADRVDCGRLQCSFVSISSSYDARIRNATQKDYVAKADVLGDEHSLLLERKRG